MTKPLAPFGLRSELLTVNHSDLQRAKAARQVKARGSMWPTTRSTTTACAPGVVIADIADLRAETDTTADELSQLGYSTVWSRRSRSTIVGLCVLVFARARSSSLGRTTGRDPKTSHGLSTLSSKTENG